MQYSILHINRVIGRISCFRDFHLFHKCLSGKLTYPGTVGNADDELFMEDRLEEKINHPIGTRPGLEKRKKMPAKKELELQQRKYIKRKIIEKKERALYGEKMPRLLTWAARLQIIYLNKTDPAYWTPDMLAESFPVSKHGVIRILKQNHIPLDEEYIHEYDKGVYMNWLRLKKAKQDFINGRTVDPEFRSIVESEKLSLMKNAAGSLTLPIPETSYLQVTQKTIAEKRRPKTKGEFSAILDNYEKDKETVKKEKKLKYIEFEDPDYVALLTGLSEMKDEEEIQEERYKEHTAQDKYEDTKLFYDEYEDNIDLDVSDLPVYKSRNKTQNFTHNRDELTENRKEGLNRQSTFLNRKQHFGRKNPSEEDKNENDFQKNIAKWVKESSRALDTNVKKIRK
ncbi:uncharacterized protein LOC123522814 [Mercenaria mercenaria]|uniref:uncharacterized protein LOC123522814 n=1 Tax=Mercenaria mercenaria TaxID=6596 RepID=UPI00234F7E7C|nr:uncharacterized protein LOC123522814 [Mercenaria mercenaria]